MSATTTINQTRLEVVPPSIPSGDVQTKLHFSVPPADGTIPYNFVEKQPEGVAQTNLTTEEKEVTVHDMRGRESSYEVDTHGFGIFKSHAGSSPDVDFYDDDSVKSKYYPEVEQLLKTNIPGTHKVVIFDHTRRKADPAANRNPVQRAHIDQTAEAAARRVPLHVEDPDEAARLLKGRYRIVNVWRPLNGPVESFPLAVADSTTHPDENLFPVEHRYPTRTGYTGGVSYSDKTRWYYLSGMRDDERLFLQCFDSGSNSRVPHTAFVHPGSTEKSKPRESIEVRALVFG